MKRLRHRNKELARKDIAIAMAAGTLEFCNLNKREHSLWDGRFIALHYDG